MPDAEGTPRGNTHNDDRNTLVDIISKLESCLQQSDELGLTLLSARVDFALHEAKRQAGP